MCADLAAPGDDRYEIGGDAVFALVSMCKGKGRGARL